MENSLNVVAQFSALTWGGGLMGYMMPWHCNVKEEVNGTIS